MEKSLIVLVLALVSFVAVANPTVPRVINSIELQGADGTVILKTDPKWGISCGGEYVDTVYFNNESVTAYDAMLSMTLSAYMAGKKVRFYGACDPSKGNNFFKGTYLILSDK
jgi:hypothetical protein